MSNRLMMFHVDSVDSLAQGEGTGIERGGGQSLETDRAVSGRNFRQTMEFESFLLDLASMVTHVRRIWYY